MNVFLNEYQQFRRILCICPCCGEIVRVSDLRLKLKGQAVKTWLDSYEQKAALVSRKEESFSAREEKIREMNRELGRKAAEKIIHKITPSVIKGLKADPPDVIPIMHPVNFVVFKGMDRKENISDIILLSKRTSSPHLQNLRKQVKEAVDKKQYNWQVGRIDNDGKIEFE